MLKSCTQQFEIHVEHMRIQNPQRREKWRGRDCDVTITYGVGESATSLSPLLSLSSECTYPLQLRKEKKKKKGIPILVV